MSGLISRFQSSRLFRLMLFCSMAVPPSGLRSEDLIEVDVQVLEINKGRLYAVGLDWVRLLEGSGAAAPGTPASVVNVLEGAPSKVTTLGTLSRGQIDAFLRMLETNRYGRLLAKPRIVTLSGTSAQFLVGGELPVVTQDTQGHTSVSWKEHGVRLAVKPERREALIRMKVRAEASTIDALNAVSLPNGTYMPALKTRWAETDIEMAPRSTVIIAGLIQTEEAKVSVGLPVLSDLPLLGWLFRHTRLDRHETELVIFVTPAIATPQAGTAGT